ncbi:MAG: STAS domain-containing protein [Candidatus Eisenbacteria bacterium]|nr:STAS domain-containing protein [Candidatus Eisenbacteria bacterium]
MTIRSSVRDERAVVSMAGTIEGMDFCRLHEHLVGLLTRRRRRIVLDMSGVEHVSYRHAGMLAREFDLVRSHNGELSLAGVSGYVRNILLLAGLGGHLRTVDPDTVLRPGYAVASTPRAN